MIEVKQVGFYAQLVDGGRRLSSHLGMTASGALDWQSYELGHALIGNYIGQNKQSASSAMSIEISLAGAEFYFHIDTIIALTGAPVACSIDGVVCKMNQAVFIPKGSLLTIGNITAETTGVRVYLALKYRLKAPMLHQSVANVVRELSGGLREDGSSLRAGDTVEFCLESQGETQQYCDVQSLSIDKVNETAHALNMRFTDFLNSAKLNIKPPNKAQNRAQNRATIGFIPSYQYNSFSTAERSKLMCCDFTVTPECDRMGMRLSGKAIHTEHRKLYSQGLCNGAMQCAGDGQLIIMLNDRQTIGGYPVIGAVEAFSRAKLGQTQVGESFRFCMVDELDVSAKLSVWRGQLKNIASWVAKNLVS